MPTIGPMISASARLGLLYAERMLTDVTPEKFARYAKIGDTVIESNHPAFIYGHLSLYASRVITQLGGDAGQHEPSAKFVEVFSKDAKCEDDLRGTIYPPMDEVVAATMEGYHAAADALDAAEDERFTVENPNESMRKRFPTLGSMHAFYVGGHFMMHMGQMSAWRRAMGMGPA